jgi:hypothetical protein
MTESSLLRIQSRDEPVTSRFGLHNVPISPLDICLFYLCHENLLEE